MKTWIPSALAISARMTVAALLLAWVTAHAADETPLTDGGNAGCGSELPNSTCGDDYTSSDVGTAPSSRSSVSVIGVAKTPFQDISDEHKLLRGKSKKPLYVTAIDDLITAKQNILSMHGDFRLPTLLRRVDQNTRAAAFSLPVS